MTTKKTASEAVETMRTTAKIVNAIRAALPTFTHFSQFTKRVEGKLQTALPGYSVAIKGEYNTHKIHVWGNGAFGNLTWDESPCICWNVREVWTEGLEEALDRADPTDSIERFEAEETIAGELQKLDAQIAACKAKAEKLVESLPIPPTAVSRNFRNEAHFWNTLSYIREPSFPNLFPKR